MGSCPAGSSCDLSHDPTPERVPACLHFLRGKCSNLNCRYAHVRVSPSAAICRDFATLGYCGRGADCSCRHARECPDYANVGSCHIKNCDLPHIDRAGQIRKHAADSTDPNSKLQDKGLVEAYESDISSEEADGDEIDSEDFDSDECNELPMENADDTESHALSQQQDFVGL